MLYGSARWYALQILYHVMPRTFKGPRAESCKRPFKNIGKGSVWKAMYACELVAYNRKCTFPLLPFRTGANHWKCQFHDGQGRNLGRRDLLPNLGPLWQCTLYPHGCNQVSIHCITFDQDSRSLFWGHSRRNFLPSPLPLLQTTKFSPFLEMEWVGWDGFLVLEWPDKKGERKKVFFQGKRGLLWKKGIDDGGSRRGYCAQRMSRVERGESLTCMSVEMWNMVIIPVLLEWITCVCSPPINSPLMCTVLLYLSHFSLLHLGNNNNNPFFLPAFISVLLFVL